MFSQYWLVGLMHFGRNPMETVLGPPRSVTPGLHLLPGDVTFRAWLRCLQTFSMGKTVK